MIMPQAVIAQATAIAALPTFSQQVAQGNVEEMRSSLAITLRGVLFLSLPASLGLVLLREPLVSLLLERGAFDIHSTEKVAWALLWYGAGLVGHALLEIVVRAFYAMKDTQTPVIVGGIAMTLNVVLSLMFSSIFTQIGWAPHGGLALANSLATAIECLTLLFLIRRRLNGLGIGQMRRGILATLAAGLCMSLVLIGWLNLASQNSVLVLGGIGILIGTVSYWIAGLIFKAPDAREYPRSLLKRMG